MSRGQKIRYRLLQVLVVIAVIVIVAALALRAWMKLPEIPASSTLEGDSSSYDGAELPDVAKSGRKEGVYTFLLVGQDTAGGGNTDTMMLITFDTKNKTIDGMSLPRDTMINVDRKGSGHRLNAVYNYNKGSDPDTQVEKGIAALKKEVGKLTGITPDFYVMVQWEAVGKMVDALGGVYFEVPFDMDYDDPTVGQDLHIHLEAGYQKLDGEQAMGLIRWRHNNDYSVQYPNGDLGRIQTQQAFLKAVAAECLKPATLLKAPALAEVFMENVTTDLSLGNILAFAQLAAGMDAEQDVNFISMPVTDAKYSGVSMVLPVVDELLEVLNESFNPYLSDIQPVTCRCWCANATVVTRDRRHLPGFQTWPPPRAALPLALPPDPTRIRNPTVRPEDPPAVPTRAKPRSLWSLRSLRSRSLSHRRSLPLPRSPVRAAGKVPSPMAERLNPVIQMMDRPAAVLREAVSPALPDRAEQRKLHQTSLPAVSWRHN